MCDATLVEFLDKYRYIRSILVDDAEVHALVHADVGWKPNWFSVNVEQRIKVLRTKIVVLDKSEWLWVLNKKNRGNG